MRYCKRGVPVDAGGGPRENRRPPQHGSLTQTRGVSNEAESGLDGRRFLSARYHTRHIGWFTIFAVAGQLNAFRNSGMFETTPFAR
jgi:hypothetical protein